MNYDDYVDAMQTKLKETFTNSAGIVMPKYEEVNSSHLNQNWQLVNEIVIEGEQCGYISRADANLMVPESPRPGRLYGLVKDHKPVAPGKKISPLREVVSGSGSNTEFISAFVDHHMKSEVKKLPSFVEDTPHFLRSIEEKNAQGPLPPNVFPVSMDITYL